MLQTAHSVSFQTYHGIEVWRLCRPNKAKWDGQIAVSIPWRHVSWDAECYPIENPSGKGTWINRVKPRKGNLNIISVNVKFWHLSICILTVFYAHRKSSKWKLIIPIRETLKFMPTMHDATSAWTFSSTPHFTLLSRVPYFLLLMNCSTSINVFSIEYTWCGSCFGMQCHHHKFSSLSKNYLPDIFCLLFCFSYSLWSYNVL